MSNETMHQELERLRKEVAALSEARREKRSEPPRPEEEALTRPELAEEDQATRNQVEELLKLLQDEIRDMPTITTVAVFAAGILLGRFLR